MEMAPQAGTFQGTFATFCPAFAPRPDGPDVCNPSGYPAETPLHERDIAVKTFAALFGMAILCVFTSACGDPAAAKAKHIQQADALAAQGNYAEAILEYKNALKIDKRLGEVRFKLAELQAKVGNLQAAGQEYLRAADLMPERADVQVKAASLLLMAKEFEGARKYADAALKANPKEISANLIRAYALVGLRDTEAAVKEIQDAMIAAPADARLQSTLGELKATEGNRAEAEAAFRKAVAMDPSSLGARMALGYFLWSSKRIPEAEATLKEAVALNTNDSAANRLLSMFYLAQNRPEDAETPLLRLVNAKDASATLTLADLYVRTNRQDRAKPLYETLKAAKSSRPTAVGRLAELEYAAGRREQAHAALDEELKQSADNPLLLTLKAQWLAREGRGDEAVEVAKRAAGVAPNSSAPQFVLGQAQAARGDREAAISAYLEALRITPNMIAAEIEISRLLMQTGNVQEGLKHAEIARVAQPDNPAIRIDYASALIAAKDYQKAETEAKALAATYPNNSAVHTLYGQTLLARRDFAGAAREYDRALSLNPVDHVALAGRLLIDVGAKRPQDGRARLTRAIAKEPGNTDLLILAARFEHTAGDIPAAEKHLRAVLEKDAANLEAYTVLGDIYMRQHRLDEARREFEEVVKRNPDSVPARTMIGMILYVQQKNDESKKVYEQILSTTKRAPVAANNLAWIYATEGQQLDIALQLAQDAKRLMPDSADVNDTLGWVYYKKDLHEMAVKTLESSVQKDPRNPMYLYHLGLAAAKAGEADKARKALEEALRLQPNFDGAEEARKALASIKG